MAAGRAAVLVAVATGLLFLLGVGLSRGQPERPVPARVPRQAPGAASWVEAVALDVGMAIFSLLALGLARAGQPARAERVLILACPGPAG